MSLSLSFRISCTVHFILCMSSASFTGHMKSALRMAVGDQEPVRKNEDSYTASGRATENDGRVESESSIWTC